MTNKIQNPNSKINKMKKLLADPKHPREEKTLVLIKPDAVKRGLVGEIIKRFESRGLKIIGLKMVHGAPKDFDKHYPKSKGWIANLGKRTIETYKKYSYSLKNDFGTDDPFRIGKIFRNWLIDFMASGPVVKILIEGAHAIDVVRKIVGDTQPHFALTGTIRGDFSVDSAGSANKSKRAVHNLVHASGDKNEVRNEIILWFNPEEICDYKRVEELI
ncbi:MAG: nucleoside-diphosphate kinase [Patescibacteria group bacterium]